MGTPDLAEKSVDTTRVSTFLFGKRFIIHFRKTFYNVRMG